MAPAKIKNITIDEIRKDAEILVEKDQFSLAIGKRGQNVRLASRLTGFKINITQEITENIVVDEQEIEKKDLTEDEQEE